MRKLLVVALAALLVAPVVATAKDADHSRIHRHKTAAGGSYNLVDGDTDSDDADDRTASIDVRPWSKTVFFVQHTNSSATSITATCSASPDNSTWYPIQSVAVSSGTGTASAYVFSKAVSGSVNFELEFNVVAYGYIKCVFDLLPGSNPSDTITVQASSGVGR